MIEFFFLLLMLAIAFALFEMMTYWSFAIIGVYCGLIFIGAKSRVAKAEKKMQTTLMAHEQIAETAIQKRLFSLFKRRDLLGITNSRIIIIKRGLLGGFTMQDIQYKNLEDARLIENTFPAISGSNLSFSYKLDDRDKRKVKRKKDEDPASDVFKEFAIRGVPSEAASRIYTKAQAAEQEWEEKRRIRGMEEKRAASGGFYMATPTPSKNASTGSEIGQNNNTSGSYLEEIEKAKALHDSGVISDVEFQELKSKILSRSY